ncbi:MAG: primosomal protein N', partial [Acidimicrobiales bacterium]
MPAVTRAFDYLVPPEMAADVRVGTLVRIPLHGRRVGGWVVSLPDQPGTDRALQPVDRVSGWGPQAEVVELARWAAWR